MMFKTILVPLDGSAESNAALPAARTIAQAFDAPVKLLRVLAPEDRDISTEATQNVQRIADELTGSRIHVDAVIRYGDAAAEILKESRSNPPSLIVMRTHGRVGLERAVLGSVTQQVLKDSSVPLLLLRPGGRRLTALHKLVVPVDGSPGGALALGTAVGLAQTTGASIKLLEVAVPMPIETAYDYGGMAYYDPAWDEETLASAETYVAALVKRLQSAGVVASGDARIAANVASAICEMAEQDTADLIVMSTQALTGPARALLGSVADAVVRTAHCPVLLIHRTADVEREPDSQTATPAPALT
jgi:nucleotide-binding universal stress UspA family protein